MLKLNVSDKKVIFKIDGISKHVIKEIRRIILRLQEGLGRGSSKCSLRNDIHCVVIPNQNLCKQRIMIDCPIQIALIATPPPRPLRTDDDVNSPLLHTNAITHNLVTMTPCRHCSNIYIDLNMHNSISIPEINASHPESVKAQIADIARNTKIVPTILAVVPSLFDRGVC